LFREFFEESIEMGGFRELKAVGDFLDRQIGLQEQGLGVSYYLILNHLLCSAAADSFNNGIQMVRMNVQLFGVKRRVANFFIGVLVSESHFQEALKAGEEQTSAVRFS
jgi:hypothetical protein